MCSKSRSQPVVLCSYGHSDADYDKHLKIRVQRYRSGFLLRHSADHDIFSWAEKVMTLFLATADERSCISISPRFRKYMVLFRVSEEDPDDFSEMTRETREILSEDVREEEIMRFEALVLMHASYGQ